MKYIYDLKGLIWIVIGFALSTIFSVMESIFFVLSESGGFLQLAAGAVSIVGVFKMRRCNDRFRKAKNNIIAALILSAAVIVSLIAAGSGRDWEVWLEETSDASGGLFLIGLFITVLLFLILVFLGFVFICNLLYGCRDIALREGEPEFAEKSGKTWFMYLWCMIIAFMLILTATIIIEKPETFIMIGLAAAALILAAEVRMLLTLYRTYRKFDGQSITSANDNPDKTPKELNS